MSAARVTIAQAELVAYSAAQMGAVFATGQGHGLVWMRDRDRVALLQRLSTNNIEPLRPGQGTRTVLTTPIGRMIDLLSVYVLDEALLLVTGPGRGPSIAAYLHKNIFFHDQIQVEDASATLGQLALYGPQAAALLAAQGLPGAELARDAVAVTTWHAAPVYVLQGPSIGAAGFWLVGAPALIDELGAALHAAGAQPIKATTQEVLRVEAGRPACDHEISQQYIPLEAGLWDAVSFTKGCYVGQEIIARMESRGRLAKRLCGLLLAVPPPVNASPPLAILEAEGKEAGELTSVAASPRHGVIGLAYVRTAYCERGRKLLVAGVTAKVTDLPFTIEVGSGA